MRRGWSYVLTGAMALAFVIGASGRSEASLITYICNDAACTGGDAIMVADGAAGDQALAIPGEIIVSNGGTGIPYNGWEIYSTTSESKPAIGSATLPQLDISYSLTNSTDGAGALWLYVSDTGFTGHVSSTVSLGGTSTISPFSVSGAAWCGSSNADLDKTTPIAQTATFTSSPYSGSASGPVTCTSPYSLTLGLIVGAVSTPGLITGDLQLHSVPEPVSLVLLGTGLAGAFYRRRRLA